MKYDVVVVGVGLAGLTAALRLAEAGRSVLVLAKGVGSTHLAPSTIDVLGYGVAGQLVERPLEALPAFLRARPDHPYARLAPDALDAALQWLRGRVDGYVGSAEANLLLPTAVGAAKPSTLVPESFVSGELRVGGRVALVGLRGFKDFWPALAADNLSRMRLPDPVFARAVEIAPPLDGEADVSGVGFAARFERPAFREAVALELLRTLAPGERVGFPAVLGLSRWREVWSDLEERLRKPVFEIPTPPPAVPGIRLYSALTEALRGAGGRLLVGDAVAGMQQSDGRVDTVLARAAGRVVPHQTQHVVLATGGFASGGLELDSRGTVRETALGLPVAGVSAPVRFAPGYLDEQPLARAGLAVDERLRPLGADGRPAFANVHAAGATLAGAEPWREASGNGISLATGFAAAGAILESTG